MTTDALDPLIHGKAGAVDLVCEGSPHVGETMNLAVIHLLSSPGAGHRAVRVLEFLARVKGVTSLA